MDDKGRLFGKVSVIDLFIVMAAALVIVVGILKFGGNAYGGEEQIITLKFYKEALEDFTVNAVEIGDRVIAESNEIVLGTVVDIQVGESIEYAPAADGSLTASPMEGYSSIEITAEVLGRLDGGTAVINDNRYNTGSEIIIRAGKGKIQLKISEIAAAAA